MVKDVLEKVSVGREEGTPVCTLPVHATVIQAVEVGSLSFLVGKVLWLTGTPMHLLLSPGFGGDGGMWR